MTSLTKVLALVLVLGVLVGSGLSIPPNNKYYGHYRLRKNGYHGYDYRRNLGFPKRNELAYPLLGFLPRDTEHIFYGGYGEEGFSRNGRDLSHLMPNLDPALVM